MKKQHALHAGILISLGFAVQSAFAVDTVNVTYNGSAVLGSPTPAAVGYKWGNLTPNPNSTTHSVVVGVGGDNFVKNSGGASLPNTFNAWCVDIYHWEVGGPVTYNIGDGSTLALASDGGNPVFGTARVNALTALADERYGGLTDLKGSAAFQLAVWAVMFSTPTAGVYTLSSSPTFLATPYYSSDAATWTEASDWLNNLGTAAKPGNYSITYLYSPDPSSQNMVLFTPLHQQTPPVPEPETYAMLLAGLGLLSFMGRRRKQKEAA